MADLLARVPFLASAYQKLIDMASGDGSYAAYSVGVQLIGRIQVSFTRPANTTAYATGDIVCNSTTLGSVVAMTFAIARTTNAGGRIRRARLRKTGTNITNASFRLHLYSALPTPSNSDNGVFLTDKAANYVGFLDFAAANAIAFTDGAAINAVPAVGSEMNFTSDNYYGFLEARGAYTPASAEVFSLELEIWQN